MFTEPPSGTVLMSGRSVSLTTLFLGRTSPTCDCTSESVSYVLSLSNGLGSWHGRMVHLALAIVYTTSLSYYKGHILGSLHIIWHIII